mgnify:CR=1 FL=1
MLFRSSEFISVLTIDLAKEMAEKMMAGYSAAADETVSAAPAADTPSEPASSGSTLSQAEIEALLGGAGSTSAPAPQPTPTPTPTPQPMPQQPMQTAPQQAMPNGMPQQPMPGMQPFV